MRKSQRGSLIVAIIALLSIGMFSSADAQFAPQPGPANEFVEIRGAMEFSGRVIAKPKQAQELAKQGLNQQQIDAHAVRVEAELAQYQLHGYEPIAEHHILDVPADLTENQLIRHLMGTGLFEFVEPDWILFPIACPNDSGFNSQWHHNANRMQSCDAWSLHTGGPSVTVGICDTGVQTNHPDLLLNRREGYNAVNRVWENQGGQIGPVHPHGTNTTGCAAANGNNGVGVSGTGWNLSHRMMRVSNSPDGSASLGDLTHAALTSIQAGDKVANVSYSGVNSSSVRNTATQIKNLGGLLVWAAGNDGATLNWGSRDADDVIVVGATHSGDAIEGFSARGPSMDLVAPGSSIYTTNTGSSYGFATGTSFAAPLTAGLIGLIWSANPGLTPDEVEDFLKSGCEDLGTSGIDNTYGYGRINSYNSLILAGNVNTAPSLTVHSPQTSSEYMAGEEILFDSTATDAQDGDISHLVTWTSHVDGLIGVGDFSTTTLSVGYHIIEAEIVDSGGLFVEYFFDVTVEQGNVPNIPTLSSVAETAPGSINVVWVDNSNNETGFEIYREQSVSGIWVNGTSVGTVGANATSFIDVVPGGGVGWRYKVRANGSSGDSSYTSPLRAIPAKPTGLTATLSGSDIIVSWNDNSLIESGYQVQRQKRVNNVWTNTTNLGTYSTNSLTDSPGSGRWRYRVRALSSANGTYTAWSSGVVVP
jgi:subtilisin family serine protease